MESIEKRLSSFPEGQLEGSIDTFYELRNKLMNILYCAFCMSIYLLESAVAGYSITNVDENVNAVQNMQSIKQDVSHCFEY